MYAYALNFISINFYINKFSHFEINSLIIYNGDKKLSIKDFSLDKKSIKITLDEELNIKNESFLVYDTTVFKINYFPLYQSDAFNKRFYYKGNLGLSISPESCTFKVWSPVATSITLLIYKSGDPLVEEEPIKYIMNELNGVFSATISRTFINYFYEYEISVYKNINKAVDPYAKAVGINGFRGAIIDLKDTDPADWENDTLQNLKSYTEAIIYETSIRDISMHPNSGILNKGKFLGLAQNNSKSKENITTGLDHILEMGITHVQLMPFFDISYTSIDERDPIKYNWGYDPQNYNVPEGSYSTNPYSPQCRIKELKEMILKLHKNGLRINMDVVYNHLTHELDNNFEKIFPGYYLRRRNDGSFSNGSSCSNDTASEQIMMRKFIIDSVVFWVSEYHIDGFRFDLMGLHDFQTMNFVKAALNELERNIMIYGEGWDLDTSLPVALRANRANAKKTPGIGYFNDVTRDIIKGHVFELTERGYVSGSKALEADLKNIILGSKEFFLTPEQSINYVSCHDNSTLWDKFEYSNKDSSIEDRIKMVKLSNAIVLTSQGVPFLNSGEEFLRTKFGEDNSFISPDTINALNWDEKNSNLQVVDYYKGLIQIRKNHQAFKMNSFTDIENNIEFISDTPKNVVAYIIKNNANGDIWRNILVIFNPNRLSAEVQIPENQWFLVVDDKIAGLNTIKLINSTMVTVPGISMYLAYTY